eukprot:CAMPEP_0118870978 /NCGR_PEP_ID=MMETSP1163-20130328/13736_1 /TAXON_ID=124430 /ORGANISM="Phaeomonas parva, Strain CCMP2877" /LENGTH=590 /DNA_ID=CAMNT_0006806037 /DNA_START=18 /DNA_END=1790 /DNA_ORIENTATION=+
MRRTVVAAMLAACAVTRGAALLRPRALPAARRSLRPSLRSAVRLSATEANQGQQKQKKQQKGQKQQQKGKGGGKNTKEGNANYITPRDEDYALWYQDVIAAADMVDASPVKGCMVIRPWGMSIWDRLKQTLDGRILDSGAQNAYFPLFIPSSFLSKEAEHVEGFAMESAVVTHYRLKAEEPGSTKMVPDPDAELEEPLIVRPTSETMIWHMFGQWISSHRDLPLKLNQWANVVRWEMRTRPFLRSAEFLWQEGHTAHATAEEADATAREMLEVYADVVENLLAVPLTPGAKSPSERFAGAVETYTIEALMQNGWALQSGTSHFLGQNFAKAFDVQFQNKEGKREMVWATSWGVSTRLIGALVMTHADDKGLVLPPKVAPTQVVIVPVGKPGTEDAAAVTAAVDKLKAELQAEGVRVHVDDRDWLRPGPKFFEWERKGVPLRLELGPRDLASGSALMSARAGKLAGEKQPQSLETAAADVPRILEEMQTELFEMAKARSEARTYETDSYEEMKAVFDAIDASEESGIPEKQGFFLVPWKCDAANEKAIKEDCRATVRCYPFDANEGFVPGSKKCFYSGEDATHMAIFSRAY